MQGNLLVGVGEVKGIGLTDKQDLDLEEGPAHPKMWFALHCLENVGYTDFGTMYVALTRHSC